jgi:uncharacterized protein (TIGR00369 family)
LNSARPDIAPRAVDSGAQRLIGYDVDLSDPDGSVRVVLRVEDRHVNRVGSLHGGIIAMMLDAAAGFSVSRSWSAAGDAPLVTVSLNTQFIAAVRSGSTVTATGRVAGGGRSIRYADSDLTDENGTLLARASGVFKRIGGSA